MLNKSERGRRAGSPDTRAHVLDVARRRFLAEGYQSVSLRSIAAEAGVDVALISYFYGSKRGLFAAVLALPGHRPGDLEPGRIAFHADVPLVRGDRPVHPGARRAGGAPCVQLTWTHG